MLPADNVINWMITALVCFLGISIFARPLAKLFVKSLVGISSIFVLDFFLSPIGICVGLNIFNAFICGILGIPGIAMLYGLAYFFHIT